MRLAGPAVPAAPYLYSISYDNGANRRVRAG